MDTPASRYRPSLRPFPESLPHLHYEPGTILRKVEETGRISFRGKAFPVGKAFQGMLVALSPDEEDDGLWHVYFLTHRVRRLDLRNHRDS